MGPMPSERYHNKLHIEIWITKFAHTENILWILQVHRSKQFKIDFWKKRDPGRIWLSQAAKQRAGPDPMRRGRNNDFKWLTGGPGQSATSGTKLVWGNERHSIKWRSTALVRRLRDRGVRATVRLGFTARVQCSPRARRRRSDGVDRWRSVGDARRRRRRGERDRSFALTRRHRSQVLQRGRWWRRLPVDLGHKKYSVRRWRDLGSQWEREERAAAMKSDGNLPLLPRLRQFSGELARAWQGERERGM
jgi:hypothetical protein